MTASEPPEIEKASFEELQALVSKLELQLTTMGELRIRSTRAATLILQAVAASAAKAFIESR